MRKYWCYLESFKRLPSNKFANTTNNPVHSKQYFLASRTFKNRSHFTNIKELIMSTYSLTWRTTAGDVSVRIILEPVCPVLIWCEWSGSTMDQFRTISMRDGIMGKSTRPLRNQVGHQQRPRKFDTKSTNL